ncbi:MULTISPECIES: Na+/H+ antiporter subunit E [Halomonadaceae]|jgi:multicomponent K+:H+ antiporter subunit E|uniref:Na+/H+ antiporter subunit E n=1 Tax=Halomonadaceae TaxID=28256 RepID=UPI00110E317C|nr:MULTISPECIES: Na+/H+ antiporter subunit E [Halomonas]QNU61948.1 Na+/H+ antiporter subunit E [Halomonas titanicae]TMU25063.1 Na+/H+ antiporter subunit E [Halomonas sp. ATBC28]CAD5263670.1 Multicomponent K+:H+ antiporter subunit E [Halomonas sp. 156]CAD5264789.1 Na(+) H(+) antiporter subunit E [Halomonas sp. I3]CAD5284963.1 Multicomponent K+:H+ antiporter subunit E [Halomonas sp. 113]
MIAPRSWLPTPVLSILLLVVWLLLVRSYAFGQFVLGGSLAILIPLLTHRFWDARPRISKPLALLRFVLRVLGDIVVANFEVAYLIANPWRRMKPHFIEYPLMLEDRFTITLLASTISLTPGTVSANLRLDGKSLLIHALDVDNEEALINQIRERYERPLKEIYEC